MSEAGAEVDHLMITIEVPWFSFCWRSLNLFNMYDEAGMNHTEKKDTTQLRLLADDWAPPGGVPIQPEANMDPWLGRLRHVPLQLPNLQAVREAQMWRVCGVQHQTRGLV